MKLKGMNKDILDKEILLKIMYFSCDSLKLTFFMSKISKSGFHKKRSKGWLVKWKTNHYDVFCRVQK